MERVVIMMLTIRNYNFNLLDEGNIISELLPLEYFRN